MSQFRSNVLTGLVALPLVNALGHLLPVMGTAWAVAGEFTLNPPVLILNFSSWMILDVYDKYKDMPRGSKPSRSSFLAWIGLFFLAAIWATYQCGWDVAVCVFRLLWLELLWPTPSIPTYSREGGIRLVKLKSILGVGKSAFCGILAGLMDTQASAVYTCSQHPSRCSSMVVPRKAMAYGALYSFVRETVYDARDIEEDNQQGTATLPTAIGLRTTMLVLGLTTAVGEMLIAGAEWRYLHMLARTLFSVGVTSLVLKYPRRYNAAWALFCALSLIPAFQGQIDLLL
ncbi:Uu.00g141040.m01.CDS01 [Anthostomella pinea]|uniref:Uu.00g141040.m01.CDS01 n=1 Tax=Anthostomella pinea TaxID=933095 RepID=A0AAI8YLB4_9PEZI|nr:Uu.00g141040.m01.CDS01 [Anthostomella pinea]